MTTTKTLQSQVCYLLKWDDQQYSQFIYDCGLEYLRYYIRNESKEIIDHIIRSRIFWNWWKQNWFLRDQVFIDSNPVDLNVQTWRFIYNGLHDPMILAAEIYSNGIVLGESYSLMVAELNDYVNKELCKAS